MKQRVLFLLKTYGLTVVLFLLAKVVFMLVNRADHPFTIGDIWDVWCHGLTLDLSTAIYFLVVPFLLTVISIWYVGKGIEWGMRVWFGIMAVAFTLAFSADTVLYPHWGFKLDASCLQYLTSPVAAAASVKVGWLILGLLGMSVFIALIGWMYVSLYKPFKPLKSLKQRRLFGFLCLVCTPLLFIGIRGGVDKSTTNIGQVYYSQTAFFNHSAVNPVFSFLASFESTVRTDVRYEFFSDEECARLLEALYDTRTVSPDTLLLTQRPNIILVMLESAAGQFTKISGKDYIMPNFNRMTDEGVYFSQCYANSFRTDRATVSIWSGHVAFPTMSLQKDPAKNSKLPGLARSLRKAGYDTHYYYGGDINFTKKRSYLINAGFEHFTYKSDFSRAEQRTAQWGVCDSIVFERIVQDISKWTDNPKIPHLIGYNTLSSHQPWDVPIQRLKDPVENAFNYLDQCMGKFIADLRRLPQWKNLLVIFIPDHGVPCQGVDENTSLLSHIPVLWMGGAVREPHVVDVVCNQSDQAATLLGQLGLPHDEFLFSRDVFSLTYQSPFAYHTFNNGFSIIDSTRFLVYDLTANRTLVGNAPDLVQRGKAILQVTSKDLSMR